MPRSIATKQTSSGGERREATHVLRSKMVTVNVQLSEDRRIGEKHGQRGGCGCGGCALQLATSATRKAMSATQRNTREEKRGDRSRARAGNEERRGGVESSAQLTMRVADCGRGGEGRETACRPLGFVILLVVVVV